MIAGEALEVLTREQAAECRVVPFLHAVALCEVVHDAQTLA